MSEVNKGTYNAPARPGPVESNAPDDVITKELPRYKIQVIYAAGNSTEHDTFYCDKEEPIYSSRELEWRRTYILNNVRRIQSVPSNRKYSRAFVIKVVSRETAELSADKEYEWTV